LPRIRFVVFVIVNARQLVQRFMDEGREHSKAMGMSAPTFLAFACSPSLSTKPSGMPLPMHLAMTTISGTTP
jgi:hypothetical protein